MVIKRPRFVHTQSLEDRLGIEAQRLRKEAWGTPPGVERSRLIRKARLVENSSQLSEWLRPPGLRAPT
nr:hypothetical protein [Bradyrhizobium sp. 2S1]